MDGASLRVWVPGCATGEEAYTIAMLMIEALPAGQSVTVQVFASDVDADAIELARAGLYPARNRRGRVAGAPATILRRGRQRLSCHEGAAGPVVFARQNVAVDPPFPSLDLVSCRNLLMYFEAGVQQHVLSLLHFALADDGHLFLGTAETVGRDEDLFASSPGSGGSIAASDRRGTTACSFRARPLGPAGVRAPVAAAVRTSGGSRRSRCRHWSSASFRRAC
jgi:chemotaxis methyl-accepting protein methylase